MGRERPERLWVIDPSLDHAEDEGVREILDGWRGESRVFLPALRPGDGPGPLTEYATDGVVLLGSRASVLDHAGWIGELAAWLGPVLSGTVRLPLLGICFGHQFIAHLAGAAVGPTRADGGKRLGVEASVLDGGRLLPGKHELQVIVSHREQVENCPTGYRVVARRGPVAVDGLEHEALPLFSFQFHPEAREEFARHAGIDETAIDARVREDSRRLLSAFRRWVRGTI